MTDQFTCALCHGVFEKAWADDEADAEYRARFPDSVKAEDPIETICDDCYKRIMPQIAQDN